jgi:hypothetical protein
MAYAAIPDPNVAPLQMFLLPVCKQVTADITGAFKMKAPCAGRVRGIGGSIGVLAGTTVATDLDLVVKIGGTTAATLAVVNSSTTAYIETTSDVATFAAGDVLQLNVDITGGASPTCDGVAAWILYTQEM